MEANSPELTEYSDTEDGGHAIEADGETASYSYIKVSKSGDSDGDEADFYGANAAVYAYNGADLTIENAEIETDGKHANAVFSYGEGTAVTISDSVIHTYSNCSGGLMTTGGGTMTAENLTVITEGNSSAAIRSDRGGGTVTVTGGYYEANGKGSPAIYSTADITVNDAELVSTSAQGVVVEGKNSVTLNNVTLTADNNSKNSGKSDRYQAVMLYQSMSGDASRGTSSFVMNGGSLVNKNGSVFFVTNTSAVIELSGTEITNDSDFMNIEAVFQKSDQRPDQTTGDNANDDHQRFGYSGGEAFVISDECSSQKTRDQHLPGDADVKQSRFECRDKGQRSQKQRRQIVEKIEQVGKHPASAAIFGFRQHAASLQKTLESDQRIFPHDEQQSACRDQSQKNCQNGGPERTMRTLKPS